MTRIKLPSDVASKIWSELAGSWAQIGVPNSGVAKAFDHLIVREAANRGNPLRQTAKQGSAISAKDFRAINSDYSFEIDQVTTLLAALDKTQNDLEKLHTTDEIKAEKEKDIEVVIDFVDKYKKNMEKMFKEVKEKAEKK